MKKSCKIMSIFTLIISFCACAFLCMNKVTNSVYGATPSAQASYYLKGEGNNPYQANVAVGQVSGTGEFVVGEEDVTLTATANANFQLIGWQVTYKDQSDKVEFYDISNLVDNKKDIKLTPAGVTTEEDKIVANLIYVESNGYYVGGTFDLSTVFEDLTIIPVFDHIYYQIDITESVALSSHDNYIDVGSDRLFYETAVEESGIMTYTNSYFKIGNKYYYYGNVKSDGINYYTVHKQMTESQTEEKVDYLLGAYRYLDNVSFTFNTDIDASSAVHSKNFELKGVSINAERNKSLTLFDSSITNDYYSQEIDDYLRTKQYSVNFVVDYNPLYVNTLDLNYHDLYVVDLIIQVDGNDSHDEHEEIFGDAEVLTNEIKSNIAVYNFYSMLNSNKRQFLVKPSVNNNAKSFGLSCVDTISKTIDDNNYRYYTFKTLNGLASTSQYYSNINSNTIITINYESVKYEVDFKLAEYDTTNGTLVAMNGNALEKIELKRNSELNLTEDDVLSVKNIGYEFCGFTDSMNGTVQNTWTYKISKDKPVGTTIILCFKKININVVFTNYNSVSINGTNALKIVTFTKTSGTTQSSETLASANLVGTSVALSFKVKLGDSLTITHQKNNGFNILGYSVKNPATDADYLTTFNITSEFLTNNNIEDTITIYVHEDLIDYELVYHIEPSKDNKLDRDVIMADIDVTTSTGVVTRYTIDTIDNDGNITYKEISAENNNLDAFVSKIVVSELKLNDVVVLESSALSVDNEGTENDYSYIFNYFIENNQSKLSVIEGTTNHEETVIKDRTIKVVYTMPSTKVLISIDQEFSDNSNFKYEFSVVADGETLAPEDANNSNVFAVEVGVDLDISINDISYGYELYGYQLGDAGEVQTVTSSSFGFPTTAGVNIVILKFRQIKYNFYFAQHGAGFNGEFVQFEYKDKNNETKLREFEVLTVDNTTTSFEKPLGYYVATVKVGTFDGYSSALQESNNYRNNDDIINYAFNLNREQLTYLVSNLGKTNDDGTTDVIVDINYLIFSYNVVVKYSLENPKGDGINGLDGYVQYPLLSLIYTLNGQTKTIDNAFINSEKEIEFKEIPYGATVRIEALSGPQTGLSVKRWRYLNADGSLGDVVTQDKYSHSTSQITLGVTTKDLMFGYEFAYNAYSVQISYIKDQGNPSVSINDEIKPLESIQISLYDKLKIETNAIRARGYKFKAISYKTPAYIKYEYNEDTWATDWELLFIKNGSTYVKNTAEVYYGDKEYYSYTEQVQTYSDSSTFEIGLFEVSKYVLNENTQFVFTIEYELIQLQITTEKTQASISLNGLGKNGGELIVEDDDLIIFEITATGENGVVREIDENSKVTFKDTISILASINTEAVNKYNNEKYDLTKGLSLIYVQISDLNCSFNEISKGVYEINFGVDEYMPSAGETIKLLYTLQVSKKQINITTVVQDSTVFYNNILMFINADKYGFGGGETQDSAYTSSVSYNYPFLAKADMYAAFQDYVAGNPSKPSNYKENFEITGVQILCNGVKIESDDYENYGLIINKSESGNLVVTSRMMFDLQVIFKIQPKITFNGGPKFSKVFDCNNRGEAQNQALSLGSSSSSDIQMSDLIISKVDIKYQSTKPNSPLLESVADCGTYNVIITFGNTSDLDWLEDVSLEENVTLTITKREIVLTYDESKVIQEKREYNGSSEYGDFAKIYRLLKFTDNASLSINYSDILTSGNNNLVLENQKAYISKSGKDDNVAEANENTYYNIYLYNFNLKNTTFNNNFDLITTELIISRYIQITKKELGLNGVAEYVLSKVYDGTNKAQLLTTEFVALKNKITGDEVDIDISKLKLTFEDYQIGTNKKVVVNTQDILIGEDSLNYYVKTINVPGLTIYPDKVSAKVEGVGEVKLINLRGLTEYDKIDLIPLNATLVVEPIRPDTVEYANIYSVISNFLKGNNEYSIGYTLSLMYNGEKIAIDNNLHLSIPNVKNLTGAYFLTGMQSGKVEYDVQDGSIIIDLQDIDADVNSIFLTQKKILLKAWQIVLIVVISLLVITAVVLTFVIIRRRKHKEYSVHEKI